MFSNNTTHRGQTLDDSVREVLMVIAPEMFRDEEYATPRAILEHHRAEVFVASTHTGDCVGKLGMITTADMTLSEAVDRVANRPFDAVIFVGGGGAEIYFDDPFAHSLARMTLESGNILAAICIGPTIIARAGLLGGLPATAFSSEEDEIKAAGARWEHGPVSTATWHGEVDGRLVSSTIITANGPEAAEEFGLEIVRSLGLT